MKRSKTLRTLALGFVLGAACMVTTNAVGASRTVSAIINDNLFFRINGEFSKATDENPILNYNSRIYVPVRFIAEKLGCDVEWDATTQTVVVRGAEPKTEYIEVEKVVEVEKIVYVDDETSGENAVYKKLPAKYRGSQYEVEATSVIRSESRESTKVYVEVFNEREENLQIEQKHTTLVVDGKEYKISNMIHDWDNVWHNDISHNEDVEGFFIFDMIDEDWSKASLNLRLRFTAQNGQNEYEDITINIKR